MSRPKTPFAQLLRPLARQLGTLPASVAPPAAPAPPRDDASLLREALRDVVPLRHPLPFPHPPHRPAPRPLLQPHEDAALPQDSMSDHWPWDDNTSSEAMLYLRPGQKLDTLKKLRRAHWPVQAQLDLHGLNSDEARAATGRFLHSCSQHGKRCVRIIHGKGLSSPNGEPVLKHKLRNWLMQREEVLAFCQAQAADGGGGALLVLLRAHKNR